MNRKKKIRFYQLIFLLAGGIIILFTYVNDNTKQDGIISEKELNNAINVLTKAKNKKKEQARMNSSF